MTSIPCSECGSSETRHWISCPLHPAPKESGIRSQMICMHHCGTCSHHASNGTSNEWCGYRTQQEPQRLPAEIPVNALEMQMKGKLGKAAKFYRVGKTRIADSISDEAAWLERKIRRIKRNEQNG